VLGEPPVLRKPGLKSSRFLPILGYCASSQKRSAISSNTREWRFLYCRSLWQSEARSRKVPPPLLRKGGTQAYLFGVFIRQPRRLTSSASCVNCSWLVIIRPWPRASEASAAPTEVNISSRRRSRSSQRDGASLTASSSRHSLPVSMAWRTNALWSAVNCTSIPQG